ncbi:glycosyltransferase family 4 protein [Catalinimonas alkaloidigena]|nr:glycosyltransferase family 1 protein [Catalinimonas alkaloidigena]
MKHLLIDLYKTRDLYSGLGQFSLNFVRALRAAAPADLHVTLLVPPGFPPAEAGPFDVLQASWQHRYVPAWTRRFDGWHSLHQFPSHRPSGKSRAMLTVHDLHFLLEKTPAKAAKYLARLQRNVDRAAVITAISEYTKGLMEEHLHLRGKPVHTIHNGVELTDYPEATRPSFVDDRNYFLALGVFKPMKNFHTLVPMMQHFPDHRLILAGNHATDYGAQVRREVEALGLSDRVVLPGTVSDSEKYWLYTHGEALLFPSLAEGFGLPAIEAMKAGLPVFLSRATSLPEIGGDVAFYFEAWEPEAMAALIREKLSSVRHDRAAYAQRLRARADRFGWEACLHQYLDLYRTEL